LSVVLLGSFLAAKPAAAALSPRCNQYGVTAGYTVKVCVSADLNYVYGHTYVYLNSEASWVRNLIVYSAVQYQTGTGLYHETGPHRCYWDVTGPGMFDCPSYAARNVANTVYHQHGTEGTPDPPYPPYSWSYFSPTVDP
jgi:hypothetical protein